MAGVKVRYRFKRLLAPLIWLAGLAVIVSYAPVTYRTLPLAPGEQVAGFLGESHELVTVGEGPAVEYRIGRIANEWHRGFSNSQEILPFGYSVYVREAVSFLTRKPRASESPIPKSVPAAQGSCCPIQLPTLSDAQKPR
jgi:hypothetical protein